MRQTHSPSTAQHTETNQQINISLGWHTVYAKQKSTFVIIIEFIVYYFELCCDQVLILVKVSIY